MLSQETFQHSYRRLAEQAQRHEQTGAIQKAARFYRLAAEEAAAIWANTDALNYGNQALALTTDAETNARFQLLLLREALYGRLGQIEQQEVDLVSLSTLAHYLNDDQLRARVAARLGEYKLARGEFQDVISIVNLALRLAEIAGAKREAAALHLIWGQALLRQDRYGEACTRLQQALFLSKSGGWTLETADSHRFLGVLAIETGELAEAHRQYEKALPLYHQLGDSRGESDVLTNLGNVAQARGLLGEALSYWDRAHALYQRIGNKAGLCRLLINQSTACLDTGQYEKAKRYLQDGLALSREINLPFGEGLALINLALTHHYTGAHQTGAETVQDALRVARRIKSPRLEGYALTTLGKILTSLEDLAAAEDAFWETLVIWEELEQTKLAYEARAGLARVALAGENRPLAIHYIQPVVEYLRKGGELEGTDSPVGVFLTCIEVLSRVDAALADRLLEQAHEMIRLQAADIRDEEAKRSFLDQVVVNRAILTMVNSSVATPQGAR